MGLYKLFSCNVEVQYRGSLFSRAMLFTTITTLLNLFLPLIVAYRSRGFWLRSHYFYEQPAIFPTYNYLLIAETDDPSVTVTCGDADALKNNALYYEEFCAQTQIQEHDFNGDSKNDRIDFKFLLNIPRGRIITSIIWILELDYKLTSTCPLQMKTLAVINKEFALPSSGYQYFGDIKLDQLAHLPCQRNIVHTKYNSSVFKYVIDSDEDVVDLFMKSYIQREIKTELKTTYSRSSIGHTGSFPVNAYLWIPETKVVYIPGLLQELKWAWPQYLSLAVIFYWIFARIKKFVFNNRLFMAWEVVPWKKKN